MRGEEVCLEIFDLEKLIRTLKHFDPIISVVGVCISALALYLAFYIPRRIMVNQIYADLLASYRSYEMGEAILSIFHFYENDCGKNVLNIPAKYKEKYNRQIKDKLWAGWKIDYPKTLHFQRRLVAHFYFQMASLRYDYCIGGLSEKNMETWFLQSDINLLSLILNMAKPASEVFINIGKEEKIECPKPYKGEAPMYEPIRKLYEEVKEWQTQR